MDNTTKALFAGSQTAFQNANPNTGGGGPWPDDGQHQVFVDRIDIQPGSKFRMGKDLHIPATTVKFVYTLCEDPDRPVPLTFPGEAFDIPVDPSGIQGDNYKQKYEISMDRLKGHLATVLCRTEPGALGDAISEAEALLGQETAVVCTIDVSSRVHKGRTYHTEFMKECISGPHITPAAT